MQKLNFKNGYKLGANAENLVNKSDIFVAIKHNSYGKCSEILESSDDDSYLNARYTDDLTDDDGVIDSVTSIFGVKPRYEVLELAQILE